MFWSFKTVGLQNCLGGLISLSLDNGNKMSPPPITDLGISWRLLRKKKNHCIVNFQGLFFFFKSNRMFILLLKKEQRADYLHILSYSSSFLLSSFIAWWWHYWLLFGALGPTLWSTARLEHMGTNCSSWGGVRKPHYFTYFFIKTSWELTVCLKMEMVAKE